MFDLDKLTGPYNILFVGREEYIRVTLTGYIQDAYGHFLYLTGPDDTIYNWDNIVIIKKAR